jgi:hypothetical protein
LCNTTCPGGGGDTVQNGNIAYTSLDGPNRQTDWEIYTISFFGGETPFNVTNNSEH